MRNKYAANCHLCNKRVQVGQGYINFVHGRWITKHVKCAEARTIATSSGRLDKAMIPRHSTVLDIAMAKSHTSLVMVQNDDEDDGQMCLRY